MPKSTAKSCAGFALVRSSSLRGAFGGPRALMLTRTCLLDVQAIDIISCLLCLCVIGFFGYTTSNWVSVETANGAFVSVWVDYDQPWYVDLGIAAGVIGFLATLATSILGCITLGGQVMNSGIYMTKVGLDVLAWILMLVAAACATATAPGSLSQYTDTCTVDWSIYCSFGVAVAISWAVFGLLFIASILHAVSLKHAKPTAPGDVEAAI